MRVVKSDWEPLPEPNTSLTMGALAVRIKVKDGHKRYLCGVQSCPEVLASETGIERELASGYEPTKRGIIIKSRRVGARQAGVKEGVGQFFEPHIQEDIGQCWIRKRKLEQRCAELESQTVCSQGETPPVESTVQSEIALIKSRIAALESMVQFSEQQLKKIKRSKGPGNLSFDVADVPLVICCARCGRLSKITYENL